MLIEKSMLEQAAARIRQWLRPTPVVRAHGLSERVGANVYLKLETLQPTHSFKVRGAFNAMSQLGDEQKRHGVVTASGGNHGLAIAYAAKSLGIPATVFLPESTTEAKLTAIRRLNPHVVIHGTSWDDANAHAVGAARGSGKADVHPFDDRLVMAGQGTLMVELSSQLPHVDTVIASIGGGGLISGVISAAQHFSPGTRVFGVETVGADSMHQSRKAGKVVELPVITSIAETLGARRTGQTQFDIVTQYVADLVTVDDDSTIRALLELFDSEKLVAEPAAACCVAALVEGMIPAKPEQNIVIVLCGANISAEQMCGWTSRRRR